MVKPWFNLWWVSVPERCDIFFSVTDTKGKNGDSLIMMDYGNWPLCGLASPTNTHMLILWCAFWTRPHLLPLAAALVLPVLLPSASEQFKANFRSKHLTCLMRAYMVWCMPASPTSFCSSLPQLLTINPLSVSYICQVSSLHLGMAFAVPST